MQEELGIGKTSLQFVGQSDVPVRFKFKAIKMTCDGKNYRPMKFNIELGIMSMAS